MKMEDRIEIYRPDGTVEVKYVQITAPTTEEVIAQKEQELLNMYNALQELKQSIGQ
jgi:hypothetical protein